MSDEKSTPAQNKKYAKSFIEFQYAEVKDLTKQFLTVVAAVLAVTITFSEKIVNFATASTAPKIMMMLTWCGCIAAFMLGGAAIFFIYNAGVFAKNMADDGKERDYRKLLLRSHSCLIWAGFLFVASLLMLVATGLMKAF